MVRCHGSLPVITVKEATAGSGSGNTYDLVHLQPDRKADESDSVFSSMKERSWSGDLFFFFFFFFVIFEARRKNKNKNKITIHSSPFSDITEYYVSLRLYIYIIDSQMQEGSFAIPPATPRGPLAIAGDILWL